MCFGDEPAPPIEGVSVRTVPFRALGGALENLRHPRPDLPMQVRLYLQSGMRRLVDEELRRSPDVVHVHFSRMAPYMPTAQPGSSAPRPHGLALGQHGDEGALQLGDGRPSIRRRGAAASPLRGSRGGRSRYLLAHLSRGSGRPGSRRRGDHPERRRSRGLPLPRHRRSRAGDDLLREPGLLPQHCARGFRRHRGAAAGPAAGPGRDRADRGARPAAAVRQLGALDGVEVAGDVPDMAVELERAAVSVLPVFSGSGLKNKVLEAFARGLPVVTNALGMQGVEERRPGGSISPPRAPARSPPRPRGCSRTPASEGAWRARGGPWSRPDTRGSARSRRCSPLLPVLPGDRIGDFSGAYRD